MKFTFRILDTPLIEFEVKGGKSDGSLEYERRQSEEDGKNKENVLKSIIEWFKEEGESVKTDGRAQNTNGSKKKIENAEPEKDFHVQENDDDQDYKQAAISDYLTGLFNRRYFDQMIETEVDRSRRYKHSIGFLMIDVNRFKEINDRYSHLTGDKILQEVACLLQSNVRKADTVVRYGGDEFLIILPETNGEARNIQGRIKEELEEWNDNNSLIDFPLTLAIGSAYWSPSEGGDIEDILERADRNMYEDKKESKKKN